jgi:hypothetical protein
MHLDDCLSAWSSYSLILKEADSMFPRKSPNFILPKSTLQSHSITNLNLILHREISSKPYLTSYKHPLLCSMAFSFHICILKLEYIRKMKMLLICIKRTNSFFASKQFWQKPCCFQFSWQHLENFLHLKRYITKINCISMFKMLLQLITWS